MFVIVTPLSIKGDHQDQLSMEYQSCLYNGVKCTSRHFIVGGHQHHISMDYLPCVYNGVSCTASHSIAGDSSSSIIGGHQHHTSIEYQPYLYNVISQTENHFIIDVNYHRRHKMSLNSIYNHTILYPGHCSQQPLAQTNRLLFH